MERYSRPERNTVGGGPVIAFWLALRALPFHCFRFFVPSFVFHFLPLAALRRNRRRTRRDCERRATIRFDSRVFVRRVVSSSRMFSGKMRVAVVQQFYETRVIDEFVLRGNTATLKCLVPSFVADFVDVIEWLAVEDRSTYSANSQEEKGTSHVSIKNGLGGKRIFSGSAMSTTLTLSMLSTSIGLAGFDRAARGAFRLA